ncbi:MAG: DUF1611 domain-containing protein [Gammaproteobacteria bacterium]|nr:DUF1611 domain-containing protein [Gammaproteobacteria bacterium]
MQFNPPYLIYLGDAKDSLAAKTGQGIVDWRPEWALGQLRLPGCHADLGIPDLDVVQAAGQGAKTLVIGTVSPGGVLPDSWSEVIVSAIEQGMDVASGLHTRLSSLPAISEAASRKGVRLFDVRHSDRTFAIGTGELRSGKRLLTVGTDCSVGKKYAALCIERELRARDVDADFRATGQTGIFISGRGVSIDAVVADFISGAAEWLAPAAEPEHWDVVEGQGSLFHPSFAGVSLGLLHGAQPDAFVVCHEPTRRTMRNIATAIPSVEAVIEATINGGRLTSPMIRCVGVAINTQLLDEAQAQKEIEAAALRLNVPVTDPVRFGVHNIVDYLLSVC